MPLSPWIENHRSTCICFCIVIAVPPFWQHDPLSLFGILYLCKCWPSSSKSYCIHQYSTKPQIEIRKNDIALVVWYINTYCVTSSDFLQAHNYLQFTMASGDTTSKTLQSSSHKGKSSKKVTETGSDSRRSIRAKEATATLSQSVEKAYNSITVSFGGVSARFQAVPYGIMTDPMTKERQINEFASLLLQIRS